MGGDSHHGDSRHGTEEEEEEEGPGVEVEGSSLEEEGPCPLTSEADKATRELLSTALGNPSSSN